MINLIFIYLRNNVPSVQLIPEDPAAQSGERAQREDLLPVPRHIRIQLLHFLRLSNYPSIVTIIILYSNYSQSERSSKYPFI